MKIGQKIGKLLSISVILLASLFTSTPALAAEAPEYRIQISPVQFDLVLKPGQSYTEKFEIQNTGTKPFNYKVSVAPYSVNYDNRKYDTDFTTESSYTNIVKWITFDKTEGRVESYDVAEITVRINVPKDVPGGGQYAAILAQMIDEDGASGESNVSITRQLGLVVYGEVEGNTRVAGKILENNVPSFMFQPPISATSLVENTGNTHVEASYILQVFPFLGGEEVYTNEEHPETHIILPETQRFNTISWDGAPQLGLFRVKQTVKAFGETSVTEKLVFICPVWFIILTVVVIVGIVFWIITRIRNKNK